MSDQQLKLLIVSQDQQLVDTKVDSVSVPTLLGQATILPEHIPLFSELTLGELIYRIEGKEESVLVSKGFIDVDPENKVTIMVDTAVAARQISLTKAQEAVQAAKENITHSQDRQELLRAEAELRRAMLEVKLAEKTKRAI